MRWKLFTLLAVLALMVSTASPVKVKAQGLVEYAIILVLVAIGPGEGAEILWADSSVGKPQRPDPSPEYAPIWYFTVTNTGDMTCTQTISSPVVANAGLNSIVVTRNDLFLVINGAAVGEELEGCLLGENRVSIQMGVGFPPGVAKELAMNTVPPGFPHLQVLGSTIVDRITGKTITSASVAAGYWLMLAPLS
jgi:hypothetical protein